jgi:Ca2+-binding RTX toxin-like protein
VVANATPVPQSPGLENQMADQSGVSGNPSTSNFTQVDATTNQTTQVNGDAYNGPVSGLQWQYINITSDNVDITANVPNVFIHSGSGTDALDVSKANGTNVLDGGTGSNFLVGGSGNDTFFVDDRSPSADIWSTVSGFHSGDSATVWGITPQDFSLSWVDNQGAAGYTGLTLHAASPGKPTASLTLAGYTTADLGNGKLSVSFGTDAGSGSNYMSIYGD